MTKTHLPAHMDSVRQKLRPKHQLLILKCYPRQPKNSAADAKPNGSELSYLLYYASTRSSKLQKVGAFLEKKTASDVYKAQSARVIVTLQILTALLDKVAGVASAFALIAPSVLRIILDILQNSTDISLIEATQTTWDVFCRHQDHATFAADHNYRELCERVVRSYAALAHKDEAKRLAKVTHAVATHEAIHLREIGLDALKSLLLSTTLTFESGRQLLNFLIPAILSNLRGGDAAYLNYLARASKKSEETEKDKAVYRRQSIAAVRTFTTIREPSSETDPRAAEGTVQDADALAEEEVALHALDTLKTVFTTENRAQVRSATSAMLVYLANARHSGKSRGSANEVTPSSADSWSIRIFEMSTEWTPMQDRFVVLVTIVETLVRLPLKEQDLGQHLLYTSLIDHILRSDLNLIGLSVMDVLLGLIQQVLRVLQLSGPSGTGPNATSEESLERTSSGEKLTGPSEARLRLTVRLRDCIADLGTHVYYTDQISDMISAVLLRLKPNASPTGQANPLATVAAIEEPKAAVQEVASSLSVQSRERSGSTGGFFSFEVARKIALEAVKEIMVVANSPRAFATGGLAESRTSLPISIWEGTQWLLRDPAASVRKAYVDALITWLDRETKKADFRINEPKPKPRRAQEGANGTLARRAASNASNRDRQAKKATSSFLQLLHLAIYENALQHAAVSESDILTMHLLLAKLVQQLGVNALPSGLPMIMTLQEDIARVNPPIAKVRIGSLVHGYFWTILEVFDSNMGGVGREIFTEIARRKQHKLWTRDVNFPPLLLDKIPFTSRPVATRMDTEFVAKEELRPFDRRQQLVDNIAEAYELKILSPPSSAPGSPGRHHMSPRSAALDRATSYLNAYASDNKATPAATGFFSDRGLTTKMKEDLMASWSREECLAAVAATAPKSVSLSGSRSSPTHALAAGNHRQLLAAANSGTMVSGHGTPNNPKTGEHLVQSQHRQQAFGSMARRINSQSPNRRASGSGPAKRSSSTSVRGPLRIDDLKRVLVTGGTTGFTAGIVTRPEVEDNGSDSMVDVEEGELGSDSADYNTPQRGNSRVGESAYESAQASQSAIQGSVAQVPNGSQPLASQETMSAVLPVREVESVSRMDLAALLDGISVDRSAPRLVGMEQPPY